MATNLKVLGQTNPSSATDTTLYTVPTSTSAIISTINICNQGTTPASFKIAVRPSGATIDPKHYIAYNAGISSNDSISMTIGITLSNTDVITVNANTASLSFNAFGSEIT